MCHDASQCQPLCRVQPQAASDEAPDLGTEADRELQPRGRDLLVLLPGDVTADHVIEEDAE